EPETYAVPVVIRERTDQGDGEAVDEHLIALLDQPAGRALYDGAAEPALAGALFDLVSRGGTAMGQAGRLVGVSARRMRPLLRGARHDRTVRALGAEQSNTSVLIADQVLMKILRKVEPGAHPDAEIGRHLSETTNFTRTAPFAGVLQYERPR